MSVTHEHLQAETIFCYFHYYSLFLLYWKSVNFSKVAVAQRITIIEAVLFIKKLLQLLTPPIPILDEETKLT